MTEHNIIDTRAFKNVLQDMEEMVMLMTARRQGPTRGVALPSFGAPVVFQHDIYTIVLAPNARSIQGALDKVPVNKRPALNKEIFAAYDKWYPGWTFALCCFNNAQSAGAAPMVWWYEPLYKDKVFFPALDAIVRVDHTVMVGSTLRNVGSMPTRYSQAIPKPYADLFPGAISGKIMRGLMENGDFWCELQPDPDFLRQAPPGAITKKTQKHPSTQCAQQAASRRKIVSRPRA